jgi:phosphoribosylglycinamide formyltransferase-1
VILISGRGSNMRALLEASRRPDSTFEVSAVLSDRADAAGLEVARRFDVPASAIVAAKGANRIDYDRALAAAIAPYSPALVALAGFMRILSAEFVRAFAGRLLNIHPSLLPNHPGLHTHRRVLAAGDAMHGATVHFVSEQLDAGPAVLQATVAVGGADEADLAARVLRAEHQIYPLAVGWYCAGRLRYADGRAWLDGSPLSRPVQWDGGGA